VDDEKKRGGWGIGDHERARAVILNEKIGVTTLKGTRILYYYTEISQ